MCVLFALQRCTYSTLTRLKSSKPRSPTSMIRLLATILLFGLAFGQRREFTYEDCGSKAEIVSAEIEPCDSDPCVFKRGSKVNIHFTLVADQDSDTVLLEGKIDMWGVLIPIMGLEKDMCKGVVQCPVKKGETYTGTLVVSVPSFAPSMESHVVLKIIGKEGESVCAKTPILIK
uniref:MD-2-related lipid-recognition domain-containing protein n=1 Tax=Amblyomma maculatum TaxID=34609 RepID=G3MQ32_AMBMU